MLWVEERGLYGDGTERYVKGPNNSYDTDGGVNYAYHWTMACLIKSTDSGKLTWFSKVKEDVTRTRIALSVEDNTAYLNVYVHPDQIEKSSTSSTLGTYSWHWHWGSMETDSG